jgi:hypothetical protein
VAEAIDLAALGDALVTRVSDVDPDALRAVAAALRTVAERRTFDDPTDGIELLAGVADAVAHGHAVSSLQPHVDNELDGTVAALPRPDSTAALAPLVDRLRNDDRHVRRATVEVLTWASPRSDDGFYGFFQQAVDHDDPLLAGELVHPLVDPLVDHVARGDPDDGFRDGTLSLLARYAARGWLTDAQLDAVAAVAMSVFEQAPGSATTLLAEPAVASRLAEGDAERVFRTYAAALEPPERDPTDSIVTESADRVPSGALDVLGTFLETDLASPGAFLDALPVRELGAADALSLTALVAASTPSTASLLSLIEWAGTRDGRSLDPLARPLERALAGGDVDGRDRLQLLAFRTDLESTAALDVD